MLAQTSAQRGQHSSLGGVTARRKRKLPPSCSKYHEANGKGPLCMGRAELCRTCWHLSLLCAAFGGF